MNGTGRLVLRSYWENIRIKFLGNLKYINGDMEVSFCDHNRVCFCLSYEFEKSNLFILNNVTNIYWTIKHLLLEQEKNTPYT